MSNVLPRPVQRLINELARLPGIGPKSASRLTFFLLRAGQENLAEDLAQALTEIKEKVQYCQTCFNITEDDPCAICSDPLREQHLVCVVEEPLDVVAIERSGAYRGLYHVLHGAISPIEGIGPDDLRIQELVERLASSDFHEMIIATNATLEGDSTALYLQRRLIKSSIRLTRPARGLPVGGDIEYTDEVTLGRALDGRQAL